MRARLKSICRIAPIFFASLLLLVAPSVPAQAQGLGGVTYDGFSSAITVNKDASFDVTETIVGRFDEERHGIFRYIPVRYDRPDGLPFSIRVRVTGVERDDEREPFQEYKSGAFKVIKIGDPDVTFRGPFTYRISYHVENALLYQAMEDELYWNVMGDGWDGNSPAVKATVKLPGLSADQIHGDCFVGAFGSKETCQPTISRETFEASADRPLTVSVRFPKNFVTEPGSDVKFLWWLSDNWDLVFFPLLPLAVLIVLFHRWWHHGRDPKGRGTIVAEYEAPADLRPAELGTLVDARFQPREFSATIVDLAVRGYLVIVEKKSEGLFGKASYTLKKSKDADEGLKPYERTVLDGVFGGADEVELDERRIALSKARQEAEAAVYASMASDGFYVKNPQTARLIHFGIGIAFIALGVMIGGEISDITSRPVAMFCFFAAGGFFLLFAPFMPKKTEKGAVAADLGLGFKEYLEKAEKYRVQWQEKEGIFEKYLPYAMVFGVADKWAKALAEKATVQPGWYVGSFGNWNAGEFGDRITSFTSSMAAASAPVSSGGGGGGGFSGGGFGGGGGGSW